MPLRDQAGLTALLGRLYDPSSPDYRHFLSVEQFTEQFGPTAEDYRGVVDFAQAQGLTVTGEPANRLLVPVRGTVAQIEKAFHLSMKIYQHPTEQRTFFSPDREPSLNLSVPVAHIAGLNNFSTPRPMLKKVAAGQALARVPQYGSGPGGQYIASDMRAAYYGGTALTGSGQAVGLVEFDGYYLADVDLVLDNIGQSNSVPINKVLLDGVSGDPVNYGDAEQVLDIVQAIGMAPGLSQVRVYIGSSDASMFNAMATENICKQLSVSWLWAPDDPQTVDPIFQEFAAQGQSLFVGSGDDGAYRPPDYGPWFPADDPYVTAVGGTSLVTNGTGGSWMSEQAWNSSAGGSSPDGFAIPSWQTGAVNPSNGGSTTVRNVPDVAMEADTDNYNCTMGVCLGFAWGGTSFSAPRWAGFMALVNQQAVAGGQQTVGFINPTIYSIGNSPSYASAFHDTTSGSNDCCGQPLWYNAVSGYDLVTGWGSPNGQNLIDALAGPGARGFTLTNSALTTRLSINQGEFGTTTITVNGQGGFNDSVNLAVSGLPSGVTAEFGTNPTTGSSVLTVTASGSAIPGTAYVIVAGASGTLTATTSFALTVVGPSFTLSVPPLPVTTYVGSPGATTVTVNDQDGFSGSVDLAVSGLPSNVTASFNPNPATGSSELTFTTSKSPSSTMPYYLTITGTSGTLTASAFLSLFVQPPLFLISSSPDSLTVATGSSGSSTITVTPYYGFTGAVALTASGLPSGVTALFSPSSTTDTSTLTLTVGRSAPVGTWTVTITGTSPGLTSITTINLTVTDNRPSSSVTLASSPNPSVTGQGVTFTAKVSPSSSTGTVQFLDGSTVLGTVTVAKGSAALSVFSLTVGEHFITAVYGGDARTAASASPVLVQTVNLAGPSRLTATAVSTSEIDLSWRAVPGSGVTYTIYASATPGFTPSYSNMIAIAIPLTTYPDTGLAPSTTRYYLVTATVSSGETAPSNQASATTLPQTPPSHLKAVAVSPNQINLNWQTTPMTGVWYNVYYSTTPGVKPSPSNSIGGATTTSFSAQGLQPSTTYYYVVTSVIAFVESAPSNEASAKTLPLVAPSHLTAVAVSTSQIDLNWQASPTKGITYSLYVSTTPGVAPSPSNLVGSGIQTTSFSAKGLQPSTTYYYVVTAATPWSESAPSNEAGAKTFPLVAPSRLTARAVSSSQINLSWQASPTKDVTYNVYSSKSSRFTPSPSNLIASGVSRTAYSDTGLPPSTTRYYLVTASVSGAESAPSNQASARTAP